MLFVIILFLLLVTGSFQLPTALSISPIPNLSPNPHVSPVHNLDIFQNEPVEKEKDTESRELTDVAHEEHSEPLRRPRLVTEWLDLADKRI